jgi:hypothetical protein
MRKLSILSPFIALWICSCYRISDASDDVSDPSPSEERCGETTFTTYLVAADNCAMQSAKELSSHESKEGMVCRLDIFSSEKEPDPAVPEACGDPPLTSLCFLEEVGLIDRASEGISGFPRVTLDGYMAVMTVCEMAEKGSAEKKCREQEVFYPCEAVPL